MANQHRGTRKPCHGCGGDSWRQVDKLCNSCTEMLDAARRFNVAQKKKKDVEIVKGVWAFYCLPYIPHLRSSGEKGSRDRFQKGIKALVELLGQPTDHYGPGSRETEIVDGVRDNGSGQRFYLPAGLRAIVNDLYGAALEIAEQAHDAGYVEGQQLLVGLATGEVSIDEFNKATVGKVANKRRRR